VESQGPAAVTTPAASAIPAVAATAVNCQVLFGRGNFAT
jgi:hypothetical protein